MNLRIVTTIVVAVAVLGVIVIGSGATSARVSEIEQKYSSLSELSDGVGFKFNISDIVLKKGNLTYTGINNSIAEIKGRGVTFRVAKFISEDNDIRGKYEKYSIDMKHRVYGDYYIDYLRIRTNGGDSRMVIDYSTIDLAYSLEFEKGIEYNDILDMLGLKESQLYVVDTSESIDDYVWIDRKEQSSLYSIRLLGCQISLPETLIKPRYVVGDSGYKYIAFTIGDELIFKIEENNNDLYNTENIDSIRVGSKHTIKFSKVNPYKLWDTEYINYKDIMDDRDNIIASYREYKDIDSIIID